MTDMYKLTLTAAERKAIDWIGDRYSNGYDLRKVLIGSAWGDDKEEVCWSTDCDITFYLSRAEARAIAANAAAEEGRFPCFADPLKAKLERVCLWASPISREVYNYARRFWPAFAAAIIARNLGPIWYRVQSERDRRFAVTDGSICKLEGRGYLYASKVPLTQSPRPMRLRDLTDKQLERAYAKAYGLVETRYGDGGQFGYDSHTVARPLTATLERIGGEMDRRRNEAKALRLIGRTKAARLHNRQLLAEKLLAEAHRLVSNPQDIPRRRDGWQLCQYRKRKEDNRSIKLALR